MAREQNTKEHWQRLTTGETLMQGFWEEVNAPTGYPRVFIGGYKRSGKSTSGLGRQLHGVSGWFYQFNSGKSPE